MGLPLKITVAFVFWYLDELAEEFDSRWEELFDVFLYEWKCVSCGEISTPTNFGKLRSSPCQTEGHVVGQILSKELLWSSASSHSSGSASAATEVRRFDLTLSGRNGTAATRPSGSQLTSSTIDSSQPIPDSHEHMKDLRWSISLSTSGTEFATSFRTLNLSLSVAFQWLNLG